MLDDIFVIARPVIGLVIFGILVLCGILYVRLMKKLGQRSIMFGINALPVMLSSIEFYLVIFLVMLGVLLVFVLRGLIPN